MAAWALAPLCDECARRSARAAPRQKLLRDPAFVAVLAAASLIQASHAVFYGFSAQCNGMPPVSTALTSPHCGRSAWLQKSCCSPCRPVCRPFFTPTTLLMVGRCGRDCALAGYGDRSADARTAVAAVAARIVIRRHPSRRADVSCASHAPAGQAATAQGYLAIAAGAGDGGRHGSIGRALSQDFGSRAYAAMALAAFAGGACGLVAHRSRRNAATLSVPGSA